MIELRSPIRYEIDAAEQENGSWVLNYKEHFNDKDWRDASKDSAEIFAKMKGLIEVDMDDEKRMASFTMRGTKNKIMNMLAGEFLSFSELGGTSLRDLFGIVTVKLAKTGAFEEKKLND